MKRDLGSRAQGLYSMILQNKLVTVCVLFTIFTMLDTIPIVLGIWPAKEGLGPYIHLLARFVLHSILVSGLFLFDILRKRIESGFVTYLATFVVTWAMLMAYVWLNSLVVEMHPDAFVDITISYAFMYVLVGIVIFALSKRKRKEIS